MDGRFSEDHSEASGVIEVDRGRQRFRFTMKRIFTYRNVTKRWANYENPENRTGMVYAKFSAVYPLLPYGELQDRILRGIANCVADGNVRIR